MYKIINLCNSDIALAQSCAVLYLYCTELLKSQNVADQVRCSFANSGQIKIFLSQIRSGAEIFGQNCK